MKDKEAAAILLELLKKYPLTEPETEAVKSAVGVLAWTSLAEGRIRAQKAKRERRRLLDD